MERRDSWRPTVAVVIPTLNAGEGLRNVLDGLARQTVKPCEIVVVDSESADQTCDVARTFGCRILHIDRKDFDHGGTRNLAIRSTVSDAIVLLTQDAVPANERMIEELIKPLADEDVAIAYGRQLPRAGAGRLERFAREFNYGPVCVVKTRASIATMGMKAFMCSDSCSSIRRSTFEEMGGFAVGLVVNEDMVFAARAILRGMKVFYAVDAKVVHSHAFTLCSLWQRYYRTGQFFADNKWLTEEAGLAGYGAGMVREGMKVFWREKAFGAMAGLLWETAVKAAAVRAGSLNRRLRSKA
jgi:rhamnosyltransferase